MITRLLIYTPMFGALIWWASGYCGWRPAMRRHPIQSVVLLIILYAAILQGGTKGDPGEPPQKPTVRAVAWWDAERGRWVPIGAPISVVETNTPPTEPSP